MKASAVASTVLRRWRFLWVQIQSYKTFSDKKHGILQKKGHKSKFLSEVMNSGNSELTFFIWLWRKLVTIGTKMQAIYFFPLLFSDLRGLENDWKYFDIDLIFIARWKTEFCMRMCLWDVFVFGCEKYSYNCRVKSHSSALLIWRYILRLRQRGRCCFCAACPNRKMYLVIRNADEGDARCKILWASVWRILIRMKIASYCWGELLL